jgi:hypothetical protein
VTDRSNAVTQAVVAAAFALADERARLLAARSELPGGSRALDGAVAALDAALTQLREVRPEGLPQ